MKLTNAIFRVAVSFSARNLKIIPLHDISAGECSCLKGCSPKEAGKHPRINNWPKHATSDVLKISEWWVKWPNANIGVVTGETNGFFGVDIDDMETWQELLASHGPMPETFSYLSGSGNPHFWFKWPEDGNVTNRSGDLPYGIDIRGNGGYLVVPPSVTFRGEYRDANDADIAESPDWLLSLIRKTNDKFDYVSESESVTFSDLSVSEQRRITGYVQEAKEQELGRLSLNALQNVHWDPTTFEVAANLFELAKAPWANLTVADVAEMVREAVPDFDSDGWNQNRLDRILESAEKRVFQKPGCRPFPDDPNADKFGKELDSFFASVHDIGQMADPSFLWTGKLLASELSLLVGDGGMGKGLLCAWLIKNLGMGTLDGDFHGRPIRSLFISHEEVYNLHTLPRLRASGMSENALNHYAMFGDLNKLTTDMLTLDREKLDALLSRCVQRGIEMVILDPIQGFLPFGIDANQPQQLQRALTPIGAAAHKYNISIIGIHHISKGGTSNASAKVAGSMAWRNTARSVVYLERDPDGPDGFDRVITALKNNYAAESAPIRYRTEGVEVEGLAKPVGRIVLGETIDDSTADDFAIASTLTARDRGFELSARNKCELEIIRMLLDEPIGKEPKEIKFAISRRVGTNEKTVYRAFNALKDQGIVDSTSSVGIAGVWRVSDKDKAVRYLEMVSPKKRFDPNDLIV